MTRPRSKTAPNRIPVRHTVFCNQTKVLTIDDINSILFSHNNTSIITMRRRRSRRTGRQRNAGSESDDDVVDEPMNSEGGENNNRDGTPSSAPSISTDVVTPSSVAASTARREKRRLLRTRRTDSSPNRANRNTTEAAGATPQHGDSTVEGYSSEDTLDTQDTCGSLPGQPLQGLNINEAQQQPASSSGPAVVAPDCIAPTIAPGAVHARGRAFGEIPVWIRRQYRQQPNNPNPGSPSSSSGLVQRRGGGVSSGNNRGGPDSSVGRSTRQLGSASSRGSTMLGSSSSHHHRQVRLRARRTSARLSTTILGGSVRNLFASFRSSASGLPQAEPLDAEMVVYAQVLDDDEEEIVPVYSPELVVYSFFLITLGIMIGRMTS
jgi:hypothetical protein